MDKLRVPTKMEDISVVIPLYNKALYIERAIQSVLGQTLSLREIIVIDDGSTDGGGEVVKSIQDPRIVLVRQENQGVSAARNRGIELAKSELIAFLDADDAWNNDYLKEVIHLRHLFPEAGAYATAWEKVNEKGEKKILEYKFSAFKEPHNLFHFFIEGALGPGIHASAVTISKNVFQKIGTFKVGEIRCEEKDMFLRIALNYPIAWSSKPLVTVYFNTYDREKIRSTRLFSEEPAVSETARLAIESGALDKYQVKRLKEFIASYQITAARNLLLQGNKKEAFKILEYAKGTDRYKNEWRWYWTLLAKLPFNLFPKYEKIKKLESTFRKKYLKKIPISYETEKNGKKT